MKHVNEFIAWGLSHAKRASVPQGARLLIPTEQVGTAGEWEYLFGTTGRRCTKALLDAKYKSQYRGWGWSRAEYDRVTKGWAESGVTVCDCQGLEDCFSRADTNSRGNYARYCTAKGLVSKLSREYVTGEALFHGTPISHVGWVCGFMPDGEPLVLQERGLRHGCVVTRFSDGGSSGKRWKYRGLMEKRYLYGGNNAAPTWSASRVLKRGMIGADVRALKDTLVQKGYLHRATHSIFGGDTEAAVRAFQTENKLAIDGRAGRQTVTALGGKWYG